MQSFWDVHTHNKSTKKNSIFNVIAGKDKIPDSGYFSIGIHPWYFQEKQAKELLESVITQARNPKCVAIGECGLDKLKGDELNFQEQVFISQIKIAKEFNKPLIIHCVKYYTQLKKIIDQSNFFGPVILHGFNQKNKISELFGAENYYFSLGKSLLNSSGNSQEILKKYYPKRILFETDNSDVLIEEIYEKASQILNIEKNKINIEIQNNIKTIFAEIII